MDEEKPQIRDMEDMLEHIKKVQELKSDKECSELLGISPRFYKDVKAGRKHVSNEKALEIAAKAFLSPDSVLVFIQREKAHSVEETAIWDDVLHTATSHNG